MDIQPLCRLRRIGTGLVLKKGVDDELLAEEGVGSVPELDK